MDVLSFLNETFVNTVIDIMAWVVFSLLLFETINLLTNDSFYKRIEKSRLTQPFWAALMGSIPGCGGPILLTNLYIKDTITIGSLTACFIATFGDAAFVILATEPIVFLWLLVISLVVGIFVGYLIDFTFLGKKLNKKIKVGREKQDKNKKIKNEKKIHLQKEPSKRFLFYDGSVLNKLFFIMFILVFPSTVLNIILSVNDLEKASGFWLYYSYFANAIAVLLVLIYVPYFFIRMYILRGYDDRNRFDMHIDEFHIEINSEKNGKDEGLTKKALKQEAERDFNEIQRYVFLNSIFIMTWVFFGLFIFGLLFYPFADFWNSFFGLAGGFIGVLIAVAVGMIPGCGPQIAFASFYLGVGPNSNWTAGTGPVSDSAIAANSINQDGDAGFPLLALDRTSFFLIRVLNTIPAIITGGILLAFNVSFL